MLKTLLASSVWKMAGHLKGYSMTWKTKTIRRKYTIFQLAVSVRGTKEKGYGLFPTPDTQDREGEFRKEFKEGVNHSLSLHHVIYNPEKFEKMFPTPRANKVYPTISDKNREKLATRNKANLEEDIAGMCGQATGQLNPTWVEWLMGYPEGWTDLKD